MHWTYRPLTDPTSDLEQGDILFPNEGLTLALARVHKWFADPKYLGFLVVSQSCDLVRRRGSGCKTPYVEIAVIRPLEAVLLSLLKQQLPWLGSQCFSSEDRQKADDFLDRILNQNEAGLGLFYLHPEAEIGIAESSVALLRVSVALRAEEHYDTLISARQGQLTPEFANKLGWLRGNLYSRVGVPDWSESSDRKKAISRIKRSLLSGNNAPIFVDIPPTLKKRIKSGEVDLSTKSAEDIAKIAKEWLGSDYKDIAIGAIDRVLSSKGIEAPLRQKICLNLASDAAFRSTIKPGSAPK